MNTDFRISVGFWQNPKTKKTIKRLGLEGVRSLQILWSWTAQNKPDGYLTGMDWEDIELAADWLGEEKAFFNFCLGMWIDETENGLYLHDWQEHNPWAAEALDRSDKARFSRLATTNREAYEDLKAKGINAISKGEYEKLTNIKRASNERQTNVKQSNNDSPTPAPTPAPTLTYIKESKDSSSKSADSDTTSQPEQVELIPVPQCSKKSEVPQCPQTELVQLFREVLPELPQARTWDNDRQKSLRARWGEVCQRKKFTTKEQGMAWFKTFFQYVRESDFLMGKVPGRGDRTFVANLPWLIGRQNFAKVLDGNYHESR